MNERNYINFDLVIEQMGDKYRARVINSPAGQAAVEFDSLFSPLELENFILRMGRPQRGMRRIDSSEMSAIKTFGTRLFRTVFKDEIYACYLRSMDNTLNQNKGLRIRLRINVPELHNLPWEFLYNPQFDQFLALSKDTPIIRYIELPYTTQALPVKTPMKILVMISSPDGFPPLDVEEEWKRLNKALKPLLDQGLVILEKLDFPTLSALQKRLRQDQVHIFHYIGHGKYFEHNQDGMLLLEDENNRGRPTSGQHLGAILHDHHTLRLVVFYACEGARTSAEDPYAGVAQTLVRQGIPAVLAMQFEIFENAAITLAHEFYSALVDGYPVDAALSEARKAIFASNNDVEWGTPVLFMRTSNGVLFRPETPAEKDARLAAERETAEKAAREKAEYEAEQERVQKQQLSQLNRLYDQVKIQMGQQGWSAAVDLIKQIQEIDPDFRDVSTLLEQALAEQERGERVNTLLVQGKDMFQNRDWRKAVRKFEQLLDLDPGHVEAQQLLAEADTQIDQEKEKQAQKRRREKIDGLVAKGKENLEKHEWAQAIRAFEQVLGLDAENAEALALLVEAERGERVADIGEVREDRKLFSDFVNCPNCGADNHRSFIRCIACGHRLGKDPIRSEPKPNTPPQKESNKQVSDSRQSTRSSFITCPACNEENSNRSLYCYNCGSKL